MACKSHTMNNYTIEVQKKVKNAVATSPTSCGTYEILGLMNILFRSKRKANKYISKNVVIAVAAGVDTQDASTGLRYFARKHRGEMMTLVPFNPSDGPSIEKIRDIRQKIVSVNATYKTADDVITIQIQD